MIINTKFNFCYNSENLPSLLNKKEKYVSSDFFLNFPISEPENDKQEVKVYMPTLVLEDKILEL